MTPSFCLCSIIVDKIDSNKDDFVSEDELKLWIKLVQKKHVYDSVQRQWSDFDIDNNGLINWDEYKNVTYGSFLGNSKKTETHVS